MADALLVVDVQRELVEALPPERRATFLATLNDLIEHARASDAPLVYVRHQDDFLRAGTPAWEIADDVAPRKGEPIVEKQHSDAFEETTLSDVLASLGADHLVICGMQSDYCVNATARGAASRNYRVTLVEDAHATYDEGGLTEAQICEKINRELRDTGVRVAAASTIF
jgi:nicotinamidase-related amidase